MPLFKNRSFLVKMVKDEDTNQENTVEVDIDEIKDHFRRNRNTYIVGGVGLGLVGITYLVMRGGTPMLPNAPRVPSIPNANSVAKNQTVAGLFNWRPISTITMTTEVSAHRQGPPSWIVKGPDDVLYPSQAVAALKNGYSATKMSKHLREGLPLPDGQQFERVGLNVNT